MVIYYLLGIIILFLVVSYLANSRDILAPGVLLVVGYLIACISCIFNIEEWGVNLHFKTLLLISVGISSFLFGEFIVNISRKKGLSFNDMTQPSTIIVSDLKIILFSLFNVVVFVLAIKDMINVAGGWLGSLNTTMNQYRAAFSYNDVRTDTTVVQLMKISKGAAYTFIYIFLNNVVSVDDAQKKGIVRKNLKYMIPVISYLILTLFRSGRLNVIMLLVAGIFYWYFLWHRRVGWNRVLSGKFVKRIIVVFIVFCITFFATRELVGRQNKSTFIDYLTMYFGGSFQLLDQFLKSNDVVGGTESFPGILMSLRKIGLYNEYIRKSLEFRTTPTGIYLGNIYTGLRRFYNDFGYFGLVIFQMIYGILFSVLYRKIRSLRSLNRNNLFLIIFYGTVLFAPLTQAMEDHFWIDICIGYFIELFIIWLTMTYILEISMAGKGRIRRKAWREIRSI